MHQNECPRCLERDLADALVARDYHKIFRVMAAMNVASVEKFRRDQARPIKPLVQDAETDAQIMGGQP